MRSKNKCGSESVNYQHKKYNPNILPVPKELKNYNFGRIHAGSISVSYSD